MMMILTNDDRKQSNTAYADVSIAVTSHDLSASQNDTSIIVDFSTEAPQASISVEEHIPDPTIHASLSNTSFLHNVRCVAHGNCCAHRLGRFTKKPPRLPFHTRCSRRLGIWYCAATVPLLTPSPATERRARPGGLQSAQRGRPRTPARPRSRLARP